MSDKPPAKYSRRSVLSLLLASPLLILLTGCDKHFKRDDAFVDLGKIEDLLLPLQHNSRSSMLVRLDEGGWSALSTRCTHEGCGLSLHEGNLLCSCCRSVFDISGAILKGPAKTALPWCEVSFENGHLYAHPNKTVDINYRFMNPKIKDSIKLLLESVKEFGTHDPRQLPQILLGKESDIPGPMFLEPGPDEELEAEFEKLKSQAKQK